MVNSLLRNPFTIWLRWFAKKLFFELKYRKRHLKIGYLTNTNACKFGTYNTIYDYVYLHDVELGDFSYISSYSIISRTTIGKFCAIADFVICGLGRHPTHTFVSSHPIFYSTKKQSQISFADADFFEEYRPITIGNDVWIGSRAIILDGVHIGDGAIIGAGSVVTKDVPAYAIVGGVPARVIRYRFKEEQIALLLKSQWWNQDVEWLRQHYKEFHDINEFFKLFYEH